MKSGGKLIIALCLFFATSTAISIELNQEPLSNQVRLCVVNFIDYQKNQQSCTVLSRNMASTRRSNSVTFNKTKIKNDAIDIPKAGQPARFRYYASNGFASFGSADLSKPKLHERLCLSSAK